MKVNVLFDIPAHTWWHNEELRKAMTVEELLTEIDVLRRRVQVFCDGDSAEIPREIRKEMQTGCVEEYKIDYLVEALSGEGNISAETTREEVRNYLSTTQEDHVENLRTLKNWRKINNLRKAVDLLFPTIFYPELDTEKFLNQEKIREVHAVVMEGLLENNGQFREKASKPSGSGTYEYLRHDRISIELEELCRDARERLRKVASFSELVKIGTFFFGEFLHIHPFSNGNGRVARLFLSVILARGSIVPVMLYHTALHRQRYLKCLVEARNVPPGQPHHPAELSRFILESVWYTHHHVCFALDLNEDAG